MRVAVIVSMKYGMTQFMLRDLEGLMGLGLDLDIYSLINRPGLFNPPPTWSINTASRMKAALRLLGLLLRRPTTTLRLLWHAIERGGLIDLAIAAQFERQIARADVILSYFADHKLFVGYFCKKLSQTPLVTMVHAYEIYRNPNPRMFRTALTDTDRVITVSEYNRQQLVERWGVDGQKIRVIRQSIDLDLYRPSAKVKLLTVGFFNETKGHQVLLEALRLLNRSDVELWVVGDKNPSIRNVDVRQLTREMGLEDAVAFFGAQRGTTLRALYRECDIFCLPVRTDLETGHEEGFPTVLAEAMAFGKPIVTTAHAGIPEVVPTVLVRENDPADLAEALRHLIDAPQDWEKLGRRNRTIAEGTFSRKNHSTLAEELERVGH